MQTMDTSVAPAASSTLVEDEPARRRAARFRHEALLYEGDDEFVQRSAAFVRDSLDAGEPVLVVVVGGKIGMLRDELKADAADVLFADMAEVGRNPGRIISAWQEFVVRYGAGDTPARGCGEPIWAGRTADELIESQRHESLLNLAFAESRAWIMCPYDTSALDPAVIDEARRSHPLLSSSGFVTPSADYRAHVPATMSSRLPPPATTPLQMPVVPRELDAVRSFVLENAI